MLNSLPFDTFYTLPITFNPGDARDRSLIGRGVLITFVGSFCRSVDAQSTEREESIFDLENEVYGRGTHLIVQRSRSIIMKMRFTGHVMIPQRLRKRSQ